jgi:hypothetical protein
LKRVAVSISNGCKARGFDRLNELLDEGFFNSLDFLEEVEFFLMGFLQNGGYGGGCAIWNV